jgi:hypothetical protein
VSQSFALSGDLAHPYVILAFALAALSAGLLLVELVRSRRARPSSLKIGASGLLAVLGLLAAVLRPVGIISKGSLVGPKVIVLADASRSVDLPGFEGTRRQAIDRALRRGSLHRPRVRRRRADADRRPLVLQRE